MNLIVGLGNPGEKYASTRHNIGFMVIDLVFQNLVVAGTNWKFYQEWNTQLFKRGDLIFAKPQTFMNASGIVVKKLADFYAVPTDRIWVIHDDLDLPLGKIRIRRGGASAGHHGVESIMREIGSSDFIRFRLGVGRGKLDAIKHTDQHLKRHVTEKFIVSPFSATEQGKLRSFLKQGREAIEIALHKGLDQAMNHFN